MPKPLTYCGIPLAPDKMSGRLTEDEIASVPCVREIPYESIGLIDDRDLPPGSGWPLPPLSPEAIERLRVAGWDIREAPARP